MKKLFRFLILFAALSPSLSVKAEYSFEAGAELNLGAGSNEFAPYYLHANRYGKITQSKNVQLDIWAQDTLDLNKRFDFAWGVEALAGYANKVNYPQWNESTQTFDKNMQGPAAVWLQQLYAEIKWRCLFLSVGLKDRGSYFVDNELSSGDLTWSGNSRGIPEVRAGFVDFQNIPLTKGWVQINGALSYGKFMDSDWVNHHFDYYTGKRNPNPLWTYKFASLRTKPTEPFMFQIGIQMVGIFGGKTYKYYKGKLDYEYDNYNGPLDFVQMLFPFWENDHENFMLGDTKGSWDIAARYRFKNVGTLRAYTEWFFEDSSGMWKQNGWDGLWGLEFNLNKRWWISSAAIEYLDLTHQSGPIYFDPAHSNSEGGYLPHKADGRDWYYNNFYYRSYVNYGLNMGTPMVQGILFHTQNDVDNFETGNIPYFRVRGVHLAVKGYLGDHFDYFVKYNHRKAWGGTNTYALVHPKEADSFLASVNYNFPKIPGLSLRGTIGIDHGTLPGNAVGGMLTLAYTMPFRFK